jgi:hypothetical protein
MISKTDSTLLIYATENMPVKAYKPRSRRASSGDSNGRRKRRRRPGLLSCHQRVARADNHATTYASRFRVDQVLEISLRRSHRESRFALHGAERGNRDRRRRQSFRRCHGAATCALRDERRQSLWRLNLAAVYQAEKAAAPILRDVPRTCNAVVSYESLNLRPTPESSAATKSESAFSARS